MKEEVWTRFGYPAEYIRRMSGQAFWDEEFAQIAAIDDQIAAVRGALPA
jgi:hypothetical protein